MRKKIDSCTDWTYADIDDCYNTIHNIAVNDYGLNFYTNQIEIITSSQMLECYTSVGMPVYYNHWSFGQQFVTEQERYRRGKMGLAYEIVINANPCISYLMEGNTMAMQALVIAHACIGHNSFFKNNETFKAWTDADAIIDYLVFAKQYITDCEERYGELEVERILDAAHAISLNGIDRYKRPPTPSNKEKEKQRIQRLEYEQSTYNELWKTIPIKNEEVSEKQVQDPEENLLYFIEKNAPNMEQWKREILRIVRKIFQYFYPQRLTQIMNEGTATFWHHTLMQDMYTQGHITEGCMLEFLASHTNVVYQRPYSRINPYALGFAMFQDIKRISINPTDEDREWFYWAGNGDWLSTVNFAAYNFKDESFIMQYLSPKVMRDMGLFYLLDDGRRDKYVVKAIQNEEGYKTIREKLANQQNINNHTPNIQIVDVDTWNDRALYLKHYLINGNTLDERSTNKILEYIAFLWGYDVYLSSVNYDNIVTHEYCASPQE